MFVYEEEGDDAADGGAFVTVWSGRFSAHWEPTDTGRILNGPKDVPVEEAIEWGRARAELVIVTVADEEVFYSAGTVHPHELLAGDPQWEVWRALPGLGPRRSPRWEHLDIVADEPIEWDVRTAPPVPEGAGPDHLAKLREALEAEAGVAHAAVEDDVAAGANVTFVVRARTHAEAAELAEAVYERLPQWRPTGTGYYESGFNPREDVRPRRVAFSPDAELERLRSLGALSAPCDACGAREWLAGQRESVVSQLEIREQEIEVVDDDDQPGTFVLAIVCGRCGNSKYHDLPSLR